MKIKTQQLGAELEVRPLESQDSIRHHLVQTLPILLTFLPEDAEILAF